MIGLEDATKVCTKCKQELGLDQFYRNRATKDGRTPACKTCILLYCEQNRDALKEKSRAWYHQNRERARANNRQWKRENRDHINAYDRERHKNNPERRRAREKRYMEKNGEKVKHRRNKLYKVRPGPARLATAARRAKRWRAAGTCSLKAWLAKAEYHGWRCFYCKAALTWETMHIEHRKPLARGGSHWPANLAPSCHRCNLKKRLKTDREFYVLSKHCRVNESRYIFTTHYSVRGIIRRAVVAA